VMEFRKDSEYVEVAQSEYFTHQINGYFQYLGSAKGGKEIENVDMNRTVEKNLRPLLTPHVRQSRICPALSSTCTYFHGSV
jgi:hypothetical protein